MPFMRIKPEYSGVQIFGAVVGITEAKMETMNHLAGIHNIAGIRQTYFKPSLFLFISIFLPNNMVCPRLKDLHLKGSLSDTCTCTGKSPCTEIFCEC